MKNKKFNFKLGTVFTAFCCLVAAVLFWLFAKYLESDSAAIKLCVDMVIDLL